MKYKKLLIFLMAASLAVNSGTYTVFASADAAESMLESMESDTGLDMTESAPDENTEDSTESPAPATAGENEGESGNETASGSETAGSESENTENGEGGNSSEASAETSGESGDNGGNSTESGTSGSATEEPGQGTGLTNPGQGETEDEKKDETNLTDKKGNKIFTDENGQQYILDEENNKIFIDENGNYYILDENGRKIYIDEEGRKYIINEAGNKLFIDTAGKLFIFDENGTVIYVDENGNPVDPELPVDETNPEDVEKEEDEHDLTPVWHPEWQGRGAEFELHPFRLIFPVYARTDKSIFVYDREAENEEYAVASIDEGAYIRLIDGDIDAVENYIVEPEENAEASEAEAADAENAEAAELQAEAGDLDTAQAQAEGAEQEESEDADAEQAEDAAAEDAEEADGEQAEEAAQEEEEPKEPAWVYVEAMDAKGEITRGYTDANNLKSVRSFENDRSKVAVLKGRDANGAFYDNYNTSYRSLTNENPISQERIELVNFALQFLGNPYVWGGTSLTEGCDCSGFAGGVYRHFGYELPRCSYEMCYVSEQMNPYEAQPGDLLFFANAERVHHVMVCLSNPGDGTLYVVEAKGHKWGIVVSRVSCERVCWGISILDKKDKDRTEDFTGPNHVILKPEKVTL